MDERTPHYRTFADLTHDQQDDLLADLYAGGSSLAELARMSGLSYSWLRRRLLKAGVELRSRSRPRESPVPPETLAEEYRAGTSILALAETYGLYYKRVRELLLLEGVELRPSTRAKREDT
ncbi:helix-turn-helix domain-containing protein [Amycolatopsis sp. NPDC098790]|uniref:helix-turn-helix domain-containing protein n=1 Tax=Amycolatopsis sp. NPDC098790 TaxID=3363939 RepID=UPI00381D6904